MTLRTRQPAGERNRAFTLIELILVMALLTVLTSLAAPALSRFFHGRALSLEAQQLLSLTRAGQSRAVSSGFPMLLWIDSNQRTYGLQEEGTTQSSGQDADPKAEEFSVDNDVQVEALQASPISVNGRNLPAIRFLPDGSADETSVRTLRLTGREGVLWLIAATNRLSYEIRTSDR